MLIVLMVLGSLSYPAFAVTETSEAIKTQVEPKELQTALSKAGFYKGSIDGVIGAKTKEAIRKFQGANDLKADGVCGLKTWGKLKTYSEKSAGIDAAATTEEKVTTTPALDASKDEDYGYTEFDSTGSETDNSELKQKLVS